jgi:hypothetical protein
MRTRYMSCPSSVRTFQTKAAASAYWAFRKRVMIERIIEDIRSFSGFVGS